MKLNIVLDGQEGKVDVDFDSVDGQTFISSLDVDGVPSEMFAYAICEATESEIEAAIWKAYDAAAEESREP